jgi:DNA-binding beta-propeller fold protein YncE
MRAAMTVTCAMAFVCGATLKAQGSEPQVIARELDNPCGVVVQPVTNHVFVSTHAGIIRLVPGSGGFARSDEIVEFGTDTYGRGPEYEIGPLGLAFLDKDTLVVGGGELQDGEELVRFYTIGPAPLPPGRARKASDMKTSAGPIAAGENSVRGEGNFYGIAVKGSTLFISSNGDDTKGWISRLTVKDGKPGTLTPFIASKQETGVDGPTGLTISPDGKLVGVQFGEVNLPGDSLVLVYDPDSGAMESKFKTGLNDLAGVAYSPKTGKLYAVDFSWSVPAKGGLFLLEPAGARMKPTRIAQLDHPSALAFAPDGTLYVAVVGIVDESAPANKPKPGTVVLFKGL